MQKQILEILAKIILEKYSLEKKGLKLEVPPKKELWDFAFGWFQLAKDLKKWPNIIVEEIKWFLENNKGLKLSVDNVIETTSVAWPYLNIKINKNIFTEKFLYYLKNDTFSELQKTNSKKTIVIDYIWANVWKPMHIWHMCTPNQGQVMINCYKKLWYNVISDSHIWDWGIIFGKLIFAYKYFWENKEELEKNAIDYLLKLYIDITSEAEKKPELEEWFRDTFKELASWDKDSIRLWEKFTKESIKAMNFQLARLNIKPDFNIWESFYEWLDLPKLEDIPDLDCDMKCIVSELLFKWIATKNNDNSVWVVFSDETKIPSCILQKRDWTHWYLASDLAAIKYRVSNWNPEKIIYFVDSRQQLHLKQAFNIADLAWWISKKKLFHANNWFISLKDWAMSTRKWRIIKLDKLLDEAEQRAEKIILEKRDDIKWEELKKLSKIIWIWAIKYWYLKKNRESDIVFDWDEFMTFEWNSWPYIQYAYVRSRKILEKANLDNIEFEKWLFNFPEEIELVKSLLKYKDILIETKTNNYPHILAWYAYELTKNFNAFYNNVHILNEKNIDLKNIRLKLTEKFSETLRECFEILWIEMPEKM